VVNGLLACWWGGLGTGPRGNRGDEWEKAGFQAGFGGLGVKKSVANLLGGCIIRDLVDLTLRTYIDTNLREKFRWKLLRNLK